MMNQWLIEALVVHDIVRGDESGITRKATLNQAMSMDTFLKHVQDVYQLEHFKYAGSVAVSYTHLWQVKKRMFLIHHFLLVRVFF